ncbi:TD and POZ domain-containing protein 3 [Araneus ventricosus]|uniref:TD and POZ domain-containing protein 3 n=1 Tax=Araneus ventricosus TaxID=182803 RepID=A0A4Y2D6Z0_ARAVE|nr:TD and POZ domain-containing protein 3 [Araneus ventricosus]
MWKSEESISQVERCLVETRTESDCQIFIGTMEKFSCIKSGAKCPLNVKSSSSEISSFSMNLSVAADSLLSIEVKREVSSYICKIFILDKYKNKVKSGQSENKFSVNELLSVPLTFSKDYLMKNKEYFLPNDELTIHCEIILPGANIDEIEYIFDCEDTQARNTDVSSEEHQIKSLTTLTDDWISMFREGILCDAKLKTATETFPVHTVVLSARSPIFKSMFTNDMKEKVNHCVDIDDLDADTLGRMLLFMYSDTLDDLKYESAKSLYFAADKYNIVSLRQRCSNFLKQNLLQSNCLDILLLADKHQDKDLKYAVQNYITKNDEAVLFSDEWRNLEENNSRLTTEVFRFIYMKNRRN